MPVPEKKYRRFMQEDRKEKENLLPSIWIDLDELIKICEEKTGGRE